MSNSSQLHGLQPTRLLCPWDFPGKSTGVGCHHLLCSCLENPMNSTKRQKDMTPQDELSRLVGAQYATGEEYRSHCRKNENHNHRKLIKLITQTTALSNSMKRWSMPCRATQDGQVMVESSDKTWSTGQGNGKPLQHSCLAAAAAAAKLLQSCPTLCDPIDGSQAPPSLGFSWQEHWSGLPFPSPMQESEKWKWSRSVMCDS